jgi:hypothetical protein
LHQSISSAWDRLLRHRMSPTERKAFDRWLAFEIGVVRLVKKRTAAVSRSLARTPRDVRSRAHNAAIQHDHGGALDIIGCKLLSVHFGVMLRLNSGPTMRRTLPAKSPMVGLSPLDAGPTQLAASRVGHSRDGKAPGP